MAYEEYIDVLRLKPEDRDAILDSLDHQASKASARSRRGSPRLEYREESVPVTIQHPGGSIAKLRVKARNLSAGGMSFLHGGFLYNGTICKIVLLRRDAKEILIEAEVRTCRLVKGHVHEIGVQFRHRIDPLDFCGDGARTVSAEGTPPAAKALRGEGLVIATSAEERKSICRRLEEEGMHVVAAETLGSALDHLKRLPFDAVVFANNEASQPLKEALVAIRKCRFTGAIIAITDEENCGVVNSLEGTSVSVCMRRPLDMGALIKVMKDEVVVADRSPIFSDLPLSEGANDLITFFVEQARTSARHIREALEARNADDAVKVCRMLKSTAGGYGFAGIADAARHAESMLAGRGGLREGTRPLELLASLLDRCIARPAHPRRR